MKISIVPGSFDPVTYGHVDIIHRAAHLFDHMYLAILHNPEKTPLFDLAERLDMLEQATVSVENVTVESFSGLTVEYARRKGAVAVVRGMRAVTDFDFEFKLAAMNRQLAPDIETVYMMTSSDYSFISSSAVKEVAMLGGDVSRWVEPEVARRLYAKFRERKGESPQ